MKTIILLAIMSLATSCSPLIAALTIQKPQIPSETMIDPYPIPPSYDTPSFSPESSDILVEKYRFETLDTNHDGAISHDEFIQGTYQFILNNPSADERDFITFDVNHDGHLDRSEHFPWFQMRTQYNEPSSY